MPLTLTAEDRAALAEEIASHMAGLQSPVWDRAQIKRYTPLRSDSVISDFMKRHKIVPCANGLYSSAKIKMALQQLSKQTYRRKKRAA